MGFKIINHVLVEYKEEPGDVDIVVPDEVTEILYAVFYGCIHLRTITVPDSVKKIGDGAFYGCSNLTSITLPAAALGEMLFGPSGKTIEATITQPGKQPKKVIAVFRKAYYSQSWAYKEQYLVPLAPKDIPHYDKLTACGEYEGFKMADAGRLQAMRFRLTDNELPVSDEFLPLFADYLSVKITKAVKLAEENADALFVRKLFEIGAINDSNEKKVRKALAKSAYPEIRAFADENAAVSVRTASSSEEYSTSAIEDKYSARMNEIKAKLVLMKANIYDFPQVLMQNGKDIAPLEYLQLILAEYIVLHSDEKYVFSQIADEIAVKLDKTSFANAIVEMYNSQEKAESKQRLLLPALFRYCDGATASKQYNKYRKQKWTSALADNALLLNDTLEAKLIADKYGLLGRYAELRGIAEDSIRAVIYRFGLDDDGKKTYDLGGRSIILSLNNDMTLTLYDTTKQKVVKSIPKKDVDPDVYATVNADFSEIKRNIKRSMKNKTDSLFSEFLDGTALAPECWSNIYLKNPIFRQIASLLVWSQDGATFTLSGDTAIDSSGKEYKINEGKKIAIAHPLEMSATDIKAWQKYFSNNKLKQPFMQVWEPVADMLSVNSARYDGAEIPFNFLRGAEKHGIVIKEWDFYSIIEITMTDCSLDYEFINWARHYVPEKVKLNNFRIEKLTRRSNHIIAQLDKWTIAQRIAKDDISATEIIGNATLAQLTYYIEVAGENKATNCMGALLELKNRNYPDFDPMDEYTLD